MDPLHTSAAYFWPNVNTLVLFSFPKFTIIGTYRVMFSSFDYFDRFYVGAFQALRRRYANMDVLVALGTNAAYFYSIYTVIKALTSDRFEGQDFFETSAMLIYILYSAREISGGCG